MYRLVESLYDTVKGIRQEQIDALEFLARVLAHIPPLNRSGRAPVKSILLDQSRITGIGNIE